jgi:hypothetical protein
VPLSDSSMTHDFHTPPELHQSNGLHPCSGLGSRWLGVRGLGCWWCLALLVLFGFLLSSCVTPRGDQIPQEPAFNWQPYGPTLPVLARASSRNVRDLSSRIFALIRVAQAAQQADQPDLAVSSLNRALILTQRVSNPLLRAELYSALGLQFQSLERTTEALEVVTRGVDIVIDQLQLSANPEARTIQVLEDLIYTLFTLGPAGFNQLRRAIQRVYIIQDLGQRVLLLTQIVTEYQRQGAGQRASLLLQQSIAALDAIENPFLKIRAYGAVARRFAAQDDLADGRRFANMTLDLLNQISINTAQGQDEAHLAQAVLYLIEMDLTTPIPGFIFQFPSAQQRQNLLTGLAVQFFRTGQPFAAELILQQLIQQLNQSPNSSNFLYGTLGLVEIYLNAEDPLSAEFFFDRLARDVFSDQGLFVTDDFALSEMLVLSIRLELLDWSRQILAEITDPYLALLALDRALPLAAQGENQELVAWILNNESVLLGQLEQQQDDGRSRLALGYARAGLMAQSLDMIQTIENPYILSLTASEMSLVQPPEAWEPYRQRIQRLLEIFAAQQPM